MTKAEEKEIDTFTADGAQAFFKLFSNPFDIADAEVFVDDEPVLVFEDPLTTQIGELEGAGGTCFFCLVNSGLRFPLNAIPPEGSIVRAEYFPEQGGGDGGGGEDGGIVVVVEDPDSIRMMRQRESVASIGTEPTTAYASNGVHEAVISAPELRAATLDPLAFLGGILLNRSAWPELKLDFETSDPAVRGWRAGQAVRVSSTKRNLFSARDYWRTGQKRDILFYVKTAQKKFIPYKKADSSIGTLFEEKVTLSTIPTRLAI